MGVLILIEHGYDNVKYIVFCAETVSKGRDWVVNAGPKELEYVNFPYWLYWVWQSKIPLIKPFFRKED